MRLITREIDVGYSDRTIEPVHIRFLLREECPLPSADLIHENSHRRGRLGWIRKNTDPYRKYRKWVEEQLSTCIADNTILVLPEFGGSDDLTELMREKIKAENLRRQDERRKSQEQPGAGEAEDARDPEGEETDSAESAVRVYDTKEEPDSGEAQYCRCMIVGGTYYRWKDGQEDDAIESVCPVILPDGSLHEQLKLYPAADEEVHGCSPLEQGVLKIFQNTGWGDVAILVCSDALHGRCEPALAALRGRIDFLIVVARNSGQVLFDNLRQTAGDERWIVAYCNGYSDDSRVFTALQGERELKDSRFGTEVSIGEMHRRLAVEPRRFARRPQIVGFDPRPRHYAVSVRSTMDFRRYPKVLAVGSHFDDIWLGCSATLMLLHEVYGAQVVCTSLCTHYPHLYFGYYDLMHRTGELNDFCRRLCRKLGFAWIEDGVPRGAHLADRGFPQSDHDLRQSIHELWLRYRDADLVFVPRQDDAHEDHVLTARTVLARFRRATILEYEVKEFRRVPFQPSLVVDVTRKSRRRLEIDERNVFEPGGSFAEKKAFILENGFGSFLRGELPRTFETVSTLGRMRVRSSESSGEPAFAEAFATEILIS